MINPDMKDKNMSYFRRVQNVIKGVDVNYARLKQVQTVRWFFQKKQF
jgi:hypothetical protein